jgi:hypothetical protein
MIQFEEIWKTAEKRVVHKKEVELPFYHSTFFGNPVFTHQISYIDYQRPEPTSKLPDFCAKSVPEINRTALLLGLGSRLLSGTLALLGDLLLHSIGLGGSFGFLRSRFLLLLWLIFLAVLFICGLALRGSCLTRAGAGSLGGLLLLFGGSGGFLLLGWGSLLDGSSFLAGISLGLLLGLSSFLRHLYTIFSNLIVLIGFLVCLLAVDRCVLGRGLGLFSFGGVGLGLGRTFLGLVLGGGFVLVVAALLFVLLGGLVCL